MNEDLIFEQMKEKAMNAEPLGGTLKFKIDDKTVYIDGSGDVTALTDGLLLIRYFFGFRGDSLICGAVGTDATRTTSSEIEDYIKARVPSS